MITLAFSDFEPYIRSTPVPVLVVFYSPHCGPSHLMDETLATVQQAMDHQMRILKINILEHPDLATRYAIHPLPTLLVFHNGQLLDRIEEEHMEQFMNPEQLMQRLQHQPLSL